MRCDVCGREKNTYMMSGKFGSYSFEACDECINEGYEPYEHLTYSGGFAKVALRKYPTKLPEWEVKLIKHILNFYNKSEDDFIKDCEESVKGSKYLRENG